MKILGLSIGWPRRHVIMRRGKPYLTRWDLLGNRFTDSPHIYLHRFWQSDQQHLHDHPWPFWSLILRGGYWEVASWNLPGCEPVVVDKWHRPFSLLRRPAWWTHRVVIEKPGRTWTLVITGRKQREWGFYCPQGRVPWRQYTAQDDQGISGCE